MHNVIPGILEKDWIELKEVSGFRRFSKTVTSISWTEILARVSFMDFNYFIKYKMILFGSALMTENPTQYIRSCGSRFKRFLGT